jgi:outer membrane cobalamin receptor
MMLNTAFNNNAKVLLNIKNATDKNYTMAKGYNQPSRTIEIGLDCLLTGCVSLLLTLLLE